jgi:hypothetical protein
MLSPFPCFGGKDEAWNEMWARPLKQTNPSYLEKL